MGVGQNSSWPSSIVWKPGLSGMWGVRRLYQQTRWRSSPASIRTAGASTLPPLLRPRRRVPGRQRRAFTEEEVFHVLGDEVLRLFLPRHEAVLVEDHLHPILPELPGLGGDVLVDPVAEIARPRRRVEPGQGFLELDAEDRKD